MRHFFRLLAGITIAFGVVQCRPDRDLAPVIPPPGPPAPTVFAVIGDYGYNGANEDLVARRVKSWNPAYVVTTGDNNYNTGDPGTIDANIGFYYAQYIAHYSGDYGPDTVRENRFFPSLGNHDVGTRNGEPYLDYFTLPGNERYYQVRKGPVEWFILNSNFTEPDGVGPTTVQGQWLQQALAASAAPWKLVVFHHPPYSSGQHGGSTAMRWPFAAWGADAVLSGHDHTYERFDIGGFPYFVNGLGGKSLYGFSAPEPNSVVRFDTEYGAMRGRADAARLMLSFVTIGGQVIDSLVLTK